MWHFKKHLPDGHKDPLWQPLHTRYPDQIGMSELAQHQDLLIFTHLTTNGSNAWHVDLRKFHSVHNIRNPRKDVRNWFQNQGVSCSGGWSYAKLKEEIKITTTVVYDNSYIYIYQVRNPSNIHPQSNSHHVSHGISRETAPKKGETPYGKTDESISTS